jgi:hypothetical protein
LVVTSCRLPNRALAEVSERVRKTLSQPSMALKKGRWSWWRRGRGRGWWWHRSSSSSYLT